MGKTFVGFILMAVMALGVCDLIASPLTIVSPQYITSVEFLNLSPQAVQVAVTYQSGSATNATILSGFEQLLQSTKNMGSYSETDTVTSASVSINGTTTTLNDPAVGVEARSYTINLDGSITRTDE